MSTSIVGAFSSIGQQVSFYFGIPILISGILGGCFLILIFNSLQTFQQNSCVFYLTIMSIFNIGQLVTGLSSRIMITGFDIDWTKTSNLYCKFRNFHNEVCSSISLTCICLATIDQFFATCSRPRWQQWSNFKLARFLVTTFVLISLLQGILYLIFSNIINSSRSGTVLCSTSNQIFLQYHSYFNLPILLGFLPVLITVSFGLLAYYNVREINYRTVPLVRRELDKQLTVMVLVQVFINSFTILPQAIANALYLNSTMMSDPHTAAKIQFANSLTAFFYYINFAVSVKY
jgi:hypothetical protein